MIGSIGLRVGSPTGQLRFFNVPFYSGIETKPDAIQYKSIPDLIRDFPELINTDVTMLSPDNDTTNNLHTVGFTDVIDLTGYTSASPFRVYWGDNYIDAYVDTAEIQPQYMGIYVYYHDVANNVTFKFMPAGSLAGTAISFPASIRTDQSAFYSNGWRFFGFNPSGQYFESYYECGTTASATSLLNFYWGTEVDTDPFVPGEVIVGPEGGGGTHIRTGENIPHAALPTISALDAGFITLYAPTALQLKALAQYLWTNPLFDVTQWKKIMADPMDAILGLSIVPLDLSGGGLGTICVGNISTGLSMNLAPGQYKAVDCGSITIPEFWGAYLDFDPYTKLEIYLPYCGTHALSADDCIGKTIHLYYNIDILSGACAAQLEVDGTTLYTFMGSCAASVPISGGDWTNMINGVLSAAASVITMAATGGATAPTAIPQLASTAVNALKPHVEKSGTLSGTGGMLAPQKPYLILTTPVEVVPKDQNKFTGYPSFKTKLLGDLDGYTEVEIVHLENMTCTGDEQKEIERLLSEGVLF